MDWCVYVTPSSAKNDEFHSSLLAEMQAVIPKVRTNKRLHHLSHAHRKQPHYFIDTQHGNHNTKVDIFLSTCSGISSKSHYMSWSTDSAVSNFRPKEIVVSNTTLVAELETLATHLNSRINTLDLDLPENLELQLSSVSRFRSQHVIDRVSLSSYAHKYLCSGRMTGIVPAKQCSRWLRLAQQGSEQEQLALRYFPLSLNHAEQPEGIPTAALPVSLLFVVAVLLPMLSERVRRRMKENLSGHTLPVISILAVCTLFSGSIWAIIRSAMLLNFHNGRLFLLCPGRCQYLLETGWLLLILCLLALLPILMLRAGHVCQALDLPSSYAMTCAGLAFIGWMTTLGLLYMTMVIKDGNYLS